MNLYTLGYQGLTSPQLFAILLENGVQTLVDVRQWPASRLPGFSKTALAGAAAAHGLRYLHLGALGCPQPIRQAYREEGDWGRYTERYLAYLATQGPALAELATLARRETCCLLCLESDPGQCHRALVAERVAALAQPPLAVVHLQGRGTGQD